MTDLNLLGRTIGRFEIISELGRGGMAVVYRARQTDLGRTVALKILPPELSLDKSYIARFLQEARSAAALEHPHIVPIYEVGQAEGLYYIAMKHISGHTLKHIVEEQGALGVEQAVAMLEQVAQALDYAHSQGVIHRDIKPSNMMVEKNGWVYLTDFGLARGGSAGGLTMAGTVMGTPEYMSPEQAQGLATIGPPTDIYALGVVLYELLTGQMPFHADTPMGMLVARLQYAPRPPRDYRGDLPMPVEDVIMRALARKPEARFATAKEMIQSLKSSTVPGVQPFFMPQQSSTPPEGMRASPPQGAQRPASTPSADRGRQGTPPYVMPAGGEPATATPRTATPPVVPVVDPTIVSVPQRGTPVTGSAAPASGGQASTAAQGAARPGSRRGVLIGVVAVVLVLLLAGGAFLAMGGLGGSDVDKFLADGRAAMSQHGGLDRAIAAYRQALASDPQNVEAHAQLALIANLRSRYEEAEAEARAAIEADSQSAMAHALLAEALNSQGKRDDALAAAERAIELDPQLSFGYGARAGLRADIAAEGSDEQLLEEAAADGDKAIAEASDENNLLKALAHSARGYVYWQEYSVTGDESKVGRGAEEFNQAIGLQGQIALFHSNLGYFYNAQGYEAQSEGDEARANDNLDRAKEKFEAALDADDQYAHAHAGLGWNLYYLKDYTGALAEFDKALELDPKDLDAYLGKATVLQEQDEPDYDQAIEVLNQAIQVAPERPNVFASLGWAYLNKAYGLEKGSDDQKSAYAESETQFRKALELNANYVDALNGLGWVLRDQAIALEQESIYTQSTEALEQSLAIKVDQQFNYVMIGWNYLDQQEYELAEEALRQAVDLKSDDADAHYWLGYALESQGRVDEAREAYQAAADLGNTLAQEALTRLQ